MSEIKIIKGDNSHIKKAIDFIITNFIQQEAITNYVFNLSETEKKSLFSRIIYQKLKLYIETGNEVIIAEENNNIVGLAILKKETKIPFLLSLKHYFPDMLVFLFKAITISSIKKVIESINLINLKNKISGKYYELEIICIEKERRGKGIGKKLLNHIHNKLYMNKYIKGIYLFTGDEKNRQIYEHLGYKIIEKKESRNLKMYHMFLNNESE